MPKQSRKAALRIAAMRQQERIQAVTSIDPTILESRHYESQIAAQELQSVEHLQRMGLLTSQQLTCLLAAEARQVCYCSKTGQPVANLSRDSIHAICQSADWNREAVQFRIDTIRLGTTAPHWIDTSPESLRRLIVTDPVGYLCYCLGLIYNPETIQKTCAGYLPVTNLLPSQSQDDYFSKLHVTHSAPIELTIRILRYHDMAQAYAQALAIYREQPMLIHELNETARRAFGLMSPFDMLKLQQFQSTSASHFTESPDRLREFQTKLHAIIAACVAKISAKQHRQLQPGFVSYDEICEIASALRGHSAFRLQGVDSRHKLQSSKDYQAMLSLREFCVDALTTEQKRRVSVVANGNRNGNQNATTTANGTRVYRGKDLSNLRLRIGKR